MNAFYAGVLLTLVLSVTTLKIDSSTISGTKQASVQLDCSSFFPTWLKVNGEAVEHWEEPTSTLSIGRGVWSRCYSHLDPTTDLGTGSQHTGPCLEVLEM